MERSIKNLMLLSWIITILFLSSVFMLFFTYQKKREFTVRSEALRKNYIESGKKVLKEDVSNAISFLSYEMAQLQQKNRDKNDKLLRVHILELLDKSGIFNNGNSTLFIIGFDGKVVYHPDRKKLGTDMTEMIDVRGNNPYYHLINNLKSASGCVSEYRVYDEKLEKYIKILTYAAVFPRWNWIVCGEVSLNELERQIESERQALKNSLIKDSLMMLGIAVLITIGAIAMSVQFSRSINRQLTRLLAFFANPSTRDNPISEDDFEYSELKFIAKSSYEMAEKILELNRELEKMLDKAKEMAIAAESANKSKSFFFMNISHELRTRMNGIMGMTEFLAETEMNSDQKRYIQTITQSCNSLMELIREIGDFSHLETGALELKMAPFNLVKSLKNLAHTFTEQAKQKSLKFEFIQDGEIPDFVNGDEIRLKEVLGILLENAIRFTNKGSVTFSVSCKERTNEKANVVFLVKDTGLGIAREKIKNLFDFAVDFNFESRRFSGVALGLAVCKHLIGLMKGELKVDSEKNKGTVFSFAVSFDLAEEDALSFNNDIPMQTTEIIRNRNVKVLLAEDDAINQSVTRLYLERFGCSVDIVCNGREALEKLDKDKYDIIFMDCEMPEMDGYTAVKAIRSREKETGGHVPIIALTANALKGDRTMCLTTGMDDHITKPINRKIIKEILNKYFQD